MERRVGQGKAECMINLRPLIVYHEEENDPTHSQYFLDAIGSLQ